MKIFTYLYALLLIVFGVSFSVLNASRVSVNYFLGTIVLPISFVIILSFALGLLFGTLFFILKLLRQKTIIYRLRKRVNMLEKALSAATAKPVIINANTQYEKI